MHYILWYDGKRNAGSVTTSSSDIAFQIAQAMKKDKWKVVWTIHTIDKIRVQDGYEAAFERWKEDAK
jgi:hypothetical protein